MTQRALLILGLALVAAGILVGGIVEPILEQSTASVQTGQLVPQQVQPGIGRGHRGFPGGLPPGLRPGFPGGRIPRFKPSPNPSPQV